MASSHGKEDKEEHPLAEPKKDQRANETDLENDIDNNNQEIELEMVVPPDGGWGWVIIAASFMCNLTVDGIIFSFGVFLVHITDAFNVSHAQGALVGSLQCGFYLMAGPFVSALANKYGFRLVAILGSVISCIAFMMAFCSNSIVLLYLSYGVLGGIGAGLIYVPAVITTGFYFERWRAIATGIAVCGSGIGGFLLPPITILMIEKFGWQGALLIQAGMLLNCAIFGAMFRPLKPTRVKVNANGENTGLEVSAPLVVGKAGSVGSLHAAQPISRRFLGTNNNTKYPTAAQLIGSSPNIYNSRSLHSLHKVHIAPKNDVDLSMSEKRLSVPIYPELEIEADQELKTVEEENNLLSGDLERLNGRIPTNRRHTVCARRVRANSDSSQKSYKTSRRGTLTKDTQRPFYRDDIFYGGSLHRLAHYKSQLSSVGYHMSVTRLPTATDMAEEESGGCYLCPESVRRILATMLDLTLLKSPTFLILALSGSLTMLGFYTPYVYLTDRVVKAGFDKETATYLLSVIGITNTIGRVICGIATSIPGVDALLINNIFISISGIATIFSGLSFTKEYQLFYVTVYGFSISAFASLRSILVVELMGLEKLTNAFGLLLLFQGVAATVGGPLGGTFLDISGSYNISFYISGTFILMSAVICYPLARINRWEKSREEKRNVVSVS